MRKSPSLRTKQRKLDKCECYSYFTGKNSSNFISSLWVVTIANANSMCKQSQKKQLRKEIFLYRTQILRSSSLALVFDERFERTDPVDTIEYPKWWRKKMREQKIWNRSGSERLEENTCKNRNLSASETSRTAKGDKTSYKEIGRIQTFWLVSTSVYDASAANHIVFVFVGLVFGSVMRLAVKRRSCIYARIFAFLPNSLPRCAAPSSTVEFIFLSFFYDVVFNPETLIHYSIWGFFDADHVKNADGLKQWLCRVPIEQATGNEESWRNQESEFSTISLLADANLCVRVEFERSPLRRRPTLTCYFIWKDWMSSRLCFLSENFTSSHCGIRRPVN